MAEPERVDRPSYEPEFRVGGKQKGNLYRNNERFGFVVDEDDGPMVAAALNLFASADPSARADAEARYLELFGLRKALATAQGLVEIKDEEGCDCRWFLDARKAGRPVAQEAPEPSEPEFVELSDLPQWERELLERRPTLRCDGERGTCVAVFDVPQGLSDAREARRLARSDGWVRRNVAGQMRDFCPTCAAKLGMRNRASMTDHEVRLQLITQYGPCICEPGGCTGESGRDGVPAGKWCAPCGHMDIYWECFADESIGRPPVAQEAGDPEPLEAQGLPRVWRKGDPEPPADVELLVDRVGANECGVQWPFLVRASHGGWFWSASAKPDRVGSSGIRWAMVIQHAKGPLVEVPAEVAEGDAESELVGRRERDASTLAGLMGLNPHAQSITAEQAGDWLHGRRAPEGGGTGG